MKNNVSSLLARMTAFALVASPVASPLVQSQEVYSQIVGAMAVSIPGASDVVVTPTFTRSAVFRGGVSAVSHAGEAGTVTFGSADFSEEDFSSGYQLLVEGGALDGRQFGITASGAATVTVSDPDTEISEAAVSSAAIVPVMTLDYMFPDGVGGVSELNPGNPQILVFFNDNEMSTDGFHPEAFYYFYDGDWRKVGAPIDDAFGSTSLELGEGVVIRNNATQELTFYLFGELETGDIQVPVVSKAGSRVENLLGLPRPVSVTLSEIGLADSSAFVATTDASDVQDKLQVYEGSNAGKKLTPAAEYYYYNGAWRKVGSDVGTSFDDAVIPAAAAIVLSKAPSADSTVYWTSTWDTDGLNI